MKERLLRRQPELIFLAVYTLIFLILSRLALYVMPFLIALVIAVVMKPLYDYFCRRFNFKSTFAATVITLFIFGVIFSTAGFLLFLILRQAIGLFEKYGYLLNDFFRSPDFVERLREALMSGNLMGTVSDIASALIRAIPFVIIFVIITFALTVWLLHHMSDIKAMLLSRIGEGRRERVETVISVGYQMLRKFIRSYLILYTITFAEAVFIFYLTGVEYPLLFALITAVADILPILGPGVVLIPIGVVFILQGNYLSGITILIFFILTGILRQVMEPKIVSDSVKIHPLAVMTGIYLSIAAMNLWILFYVLLLFLLRRVMKLSGVLAE